MYERSLVCKYPGNGLATDAFERVGLQPLTQFVDGIEPAWLVGFNGTLDELERFRKRLTSEGFHVQDARPGGYDHYDVHKRNETGFDIHGGLIEEKKPAIYAEANP